MSKINMDCNYSLEISKYIKRQIYKYKYKYKYKYIYNAVVHHQRYSKRGHNKMIEFADFVVFKAWQVFKYYVRRDSIFEVEKLISMH